MTEEEKKKLGLDDEDDEDDELDDDEDSDDDSDEDEDDEDSDDDEGDDENDEDDDSDEDEDEEEKPRKKSPKIDFDKLSKEEAVKIAQSALAQKSKLKKKLSLLEGEGDGKSAKKTRKAKEERPSNQINVERIEFRQDHPDLKRKDVDAVERFAKANGLSMEKALKDPLIKTYIQKRLEKRGNLDASISGRSRGAPLRPKGGKDWSIASDDDYNAKRREVLSRRPR